MPKGTGGHYPKGVRRNEDRGDWGITLLALQTLLDNYPRPGEISLGALADKIGVTKKSVSKWLKGINRPDPETQELVATWVRQMRGRVGKS